MSHNIRGYVLKKSEISQNFLRLVPHRDLNQGFVFIPESDELHEAYGVIARKKNISELEVIASFTDDRPVVWVETDYFGGMGEQGASIIINGKVEHFPEDINGALKQLGVLKDPGKDLFDSIGLGEFRSNFEITSTFKSPINEPEPEYTGRLITLLDNWYVDHLVRDGNSFTKELLPLSEEDRILSIFSDHRGRMLNPFQTVKFKIIKVNEKRVAKVVWPEDSEKDLNRELKTGEDLYKLFEDFFGGKILYDEVVGLIFLALSRARSEGHAQGWESADKRNKDGSK